MSIFFTSDSHYGHSNIIKYCNRPFEDRNHMNEILIENHNRVVKPEDTVYLLGDFVFGNIEYANKIISRLNGQLKLVPGNHDKKYKEWNLEVLERIYIVKGLNPPIVISHYPMRSWPWSSQGSWMLHGHVHGKIEPYAMSFDVGLDVWDYTPVSLDQVTTKMKKLQEDYIEQAKKESKERVIELEQYLINKYYKCN